MNTGGAHKVSKTFFPSNPHEAMDEDEQELFHLAEEERSLLELEHRKVSAHDNHVDAWSQFDDEFAERLLIEEMRKLPFEEQENVMFDVHGILHDIDQADPPDVEKRLEEMEMELHKIRRKKAYERAMYWDEEYVNDRSFRLRFLRCDRYRSQVAAQRIVRHFQVKQEHFGDGPQLARDIKLADLSPLDVVALESGFIQVLPVQDGAGRTVVSIATMHCPHACSIENCVSSKDMKNVLCWQHVLLCMVWWPHGDISHCCVALKDSCHVVHVLCSHAR